MAYKKWTRADLSFSLIDDLSEDGIVTIEVATPGGIASFMGAVLVEGDTLVADGVHVSSKDVAPNSIGIRNLRLIAATIMDEMGYDSIRLQGAIRTTGANPQRTPRPIRFARSRHDPDGI